MLIEFQIALHLQRKFDAEGFEAELDSVATYSDKIPVLPLDALRRDEIYRDYD